MNLQLNIGDIYALMAAFCWSGGVILFEISGRQFNSTQINLLKNIIGLICFIITLLVTGDLFATYTDKEYGLLIISAILGVAIGDLFLLHSLRRLGSGLYAIVGTSYILFIFIFALLMYGETISVQAYSGSFFVVFGIVMRSYSMIGNYNRKLLLSGIIFALIAQGLTAYSVLLIRPIMEYNNIIHIAMIRFGIGACFNIGHICYINGFVFLKQTIIKGFSNFIMISAGFMGTFLSVIFWMSGFKFTLAGRAAIYNQLSTIIITILATLFLKEKMGFKNWIAVIIAFFGAIIVSST